MKYSISVGTVHLIINFLEQYGLSRDGFLKDSRLDESSLGDPDGRIPTIQLQALWKKAAEQTGVDDLPLEFGMKINPYNLGLISYLLMNCESLGMALEKLCHYQDVSCAGVKTAVTTTGSRCVVNLEILDGDISEPAYALNSEMATYVTMMRGLLGEAIPLDEVYFAYPAPANTSTFVSAFGTDNIGFNKMGYGFRFHASWLDKKIPHANPALFPLFEKHLNESLASVQQSDSLTYKVRQEILRLLKGEEPKLTVVARALGIGERSIQLKLSEEGTSFRELLDGIRKDLATAHLKDNKLSTTDISFLLGFSEPSVFSRTFKKWTGQSPNLYRRELLHEKK